MTGEAVAPDRLPTYREALTQYHLNPEDKFLNGDYTDSGLTIRRHIKATEIEHIGKEADRWEEQLFTGLNADAHVVYGANPQLVNLRVNVVIRAAKQFGRRRLAAASGLSVGCVSMVLRGLRTPDAVTVGRLATGIERLRREGGWP